LAVRERFPSAEVTLLTLSQNRGVYEDNDLFDRYFYMDLRSALAFLWDILKKFWQFRKERFDLVLNLEPWANFSEVMTYIMTGGARVGFTAPIRRSLFNIRVPFREDEHISKSFFRILYPFGVLLPAEFRLVPAYYSEEDKRQALQILQQNGFRDDDSLIVINVNASSVADARRWSSTNFAALADRIHNGLPKVKLLFIGALSERPRVQEVVDKCKCSPVNLAGKTSLKQVIAILDLADIFITNDSGPMHLAVSLNTPTIALFGPESPMRYGPLGDKHLAIYKNHDCSPCITFAQAKKVKCRQNLKCIEDITVDEVLEGVITLYRQIKKLPE
jgi:heptosyltransferase-2